MAPTKKAPLRYHAIGVLLSLAVFCTVGFIVFDGAMKLWQLGLLWQAAVLAAAPVVCTIPFVLIAFVPVNNKSYSALTWSLGRLAVADRYLLFMGAIAGICLALHFALFIPVHSVNVSRDMSDESWSRIQQKVDGGIALEWSRGQKRILFLEEKRPSLLRALKKEHVPVQE